MQRLLVKRAIHILVHAIVWIFATYFIVRTFSLETESVIEYRGGIQSVTKVYNYKLQYGLLATMIFKAVYFYLISYFFSGLIFEKKYLKFFGLTLFSIVLFLLFEKLILLLICDKLCFSRYLIIGIGLYLFFAAASIIYSFLVQWRKDQNIKRDLLEQKKTAELNLLRSQINPHFLFNSLNNLLSIAERENQKDVSNGISQLSELLRFMLYESSSETILLDKEIEFIHNYISLNKLRFDRTDSIEISFEVKSDTGNIKIYPALLIPFVENAFKHGINIYEKSYIKIKLEVENKTLNFHVENSLHVHDSSNELETNSSGIGLTNVRRRLEILYPNMHILKIYEPKEMFAINLEIIL